METKQRLTNIDLLRILACFFIVMVHSFTGADTADLTTFSGITLHTLNAIGHTGTILFFFISGMFLLSEDYEFSFRKFYTKNFLKLLIAYISWVIIYHLAGLIIRGDYSYAVLKDTIINIIYGKVYYHFWYMPMLLGIYLLLPFLRAICHSGKKILFYFVLLFLAFQVFFPTIFFFDFPYKHYLVSVITRIPFTLVTHHVGYFVLGYALTELLKTRKTGKSPYIFAGFMIAGPLLSLFGDYLLFLQKGSHGVKFNTLFSATLCITAIGIFLLFTQWRISFSEKNAKRVAYISRLTFGIYILHPLVLNYLMEWFPYFKTDGTLFIGLLKLLIACSISLLITWLLSLIPLFKKWILFA